MASLTVEQTITFMHTFEIAGVDDDDIDDFVNGSDRFEDLEDVKYKLCTEFGSDNIRFIEDGSGREEIDFY